MATKRTQLLTLDEISSITGLSRQKAEKIEKQAIAKIINAILRDEKIRQRYEGDLSAIVKHSCDELNITMQYWVRLADPYIIKKYWTL